MAVFTLSEASAFTLSEASAAALGAGRGGRSRSRVRRGSREAGTFEPGFFLVPAPGETDRMLRAARRALDAGRRLRREARAGARTLSAAERQIAALTASAVRVYEEIVTLARLNQGRVYPSYAHLARATSLGRATIARALDILETIGFVVRQRRFRRTGAAGAGPRVQQVSNVYRPALPQRVRAYLPRWMRPAPLPDDWVHAEAERAAETEAMQATLTCRELATVLVGGELGATLARLGAAIDARERESQNEAGTLTQFSESSGFAG